MASSYQKMLHQQAVHMAAPTSPASPFNKSLANREPSTHCQQGAVLYKEFCNNFAEDGRPWHAE
jgi:hypothetical protein